MALALSLAEVADNGSHKQQLPVDHRLDVARQAAAALTLVTGSVSVEEVLPCLQKFNEAFDRLVASLDGFGTSAEFPTWFN